MIANDGSKHATQESLHSQGKGMMGKAAFASPKGFGKGMMKGKGKNAGKGHTLPRTPAAWSHDWLIFLPG